MAPAPDAPDAPSKQPGKVKWFNSSKGYGFITPDDGSEELFVHQTSILSDGFRSLAEGEPVEFSIATGDDCRPKAVDVTGPNGHPVQGDSGRDAGGGYGGSRAGGGRGRSRGYGGGGEGGYGGGEGGYGGGEGGYGGGEGGYGGYRNGGGARGGGGGGGGGGACYNCGEAGHLARNCTSSEGGGGGGGDGRRSGYGGGPRSGGGGYGGGYGGSRSGGGGGCFKCGESGHFARDCTVQA